MKIQARLQSNVANSTRNWRGKSLLVMLALLASTFTQQAFAFQQQEVVKEGFSSAKLERISAFLNEMVEKKQIAGGMTLIARRGKIVQLAKAGMQDKENNIPISESTIFRIASMSKPITSVAILTLVEDGKVAVTDKLSKFVPEFKDMKVLVPSKDGKSYELVAAKRDITIHDLLTHSSGITYGLINKPFVSKMYAEAGISDGLIETTGTIGDNVRKLANMPLVCQPGEAWEYGLNTDVLGYVVEVASGKSLEDYCRERIFQPRKMKDTCFLLSKEKHARLAALYLVGADKNLAPVGQTPASSGNLNFSATYPLNVDGKYYSGGGGMVSTIGDYFRFCQMLLNNGEWEGARILRAETVKMATQNQLGDIRIPFPGSDIVGYGFGILSEKGKEQTKELAGVGTYGWAGAFSTYFWIDPKNEIVGLLMTQVSPPNFMMSIDFKRQVYEAFTENAK